MINLSASNNLDGIFLTPILIRNKTVFFEIKELGLNFSLDLNGLNEDEIYNQIQEQAATMLATARAELSSTERITANPTMPLNLTIKRLETAIENGIGVRIAFNLYILYRNAVENTESEVSYEASEVNLIIDPETRTRIFRLMTKIKFENIAVDFMVYFSADPSVEEINLAAMKNCLELAEANYDQYNDDGYAQEQNISLLKSLTTYLEAHPQEAEELFSSLNNTLLNHPLR